jgi:hypothetical protein
MAEWGIEELNALATPGQQLTRGPAPLLLATSYRDLPPGLRPLPWHMMFLMEVF